MDKELKNSYMREYLKNNPEYREASIARSKKWAEQNKEQKRQKSKEYYLLNKEKIKANVKKYREENPEKKKLMDKQHYEKNKESILKATSEYKKANRGRYNYHSATYDASKIKATPSWANKDFIKCYYSVAAMLNREGLEVWTVDHIVPLRGKTVCGLHVENNLRVITKSENSSKSNSFRN